MSEEIEFGIETYGKVKHSEYGWIYAYETDGFGNYNLMDDANVPSLLSIPYLGYHDANDLVYRNTRKFVLSPDNPYDASGQFAKGVGSPHTPDDHIWPIGKVGGPFVYFIQSQDLPSVDQGVFVYPTLNHRVRYIRRLSAHFIGLLWLSRHVMATANRSSSVSKFPLYVYR